MSLCVVCLLCGVCVCQRHTLLVETLRAAGGQDKGMASPPTAAAFFFFSKPPEPTLGGDWRDALQAALGDLHAQEAKLKQARQECCPCVS